MLDILVKVTDHAGLSHVVGFNVTLVDENDRPTNVTVEGEKLVFVQENLVDKHIGELETQDEDTGQTYT